MVGAEITPSEGSAFVGGHVNTVVMLCKGLSRLGWDIHIVTTPSRFLRDTKFSFPWARIHLIKPKGSHNSLSYAAEFFAKAIATIVSLNRNIAFDLVHAHAGYFSIAAIPVVTKRMLGIPALFSLYCPPSLFPIGLSIDEYAIRILSTRLDKVVAVSHNVENSLVRFGISESKIEVIPPCIDEDIFNVSVSNAEAYREGEVASSRDQTVLFVGNVDPTKGLDIFLEAAERISQRNPNVKFVVTLHESYDVVQHVKALASRRLGTAIIVKGVVENMAGLMARADIVVTPFRSTEGISDIPLVILEAMALGKPVVATKVGGVQEVIHNGENGILVNACRSDELVDAISGLLTGRKAKEIGERAALSAKQFSCAEASQRLNNLYLQVIKDSR